MILWFAEIIRICFLLICYHIFNNHDYESSRQIFSPPAHTPELPIFTANLIRVLFISTFLIIYIKYDYILLISLIRIGFS